MTMAGCVGRLSQLVARDCVILLVSALHLEASVGTIKRRPKWFAWSAVLVDSGADKF
jgi:hypothetical protein